MGFELPEVNDQSSTPHSNISKQYPTIAAKLQADYNESIAFFSSSLRDLSSSQKLVYIFSRILVTGCWRSWDTTKQREFWKSVGDLKVPIPLPKPGDLGKDLKGRDRGCLSPTEFYNSICRGKEIDSLSADSRRFREKDIKEEVDVENERNRRKLLGILRGKKMGRYESDPTWDDVIPIPQEDGEGALAAISYTEEYAEAMSYLRAIIASNEHSTRVLTLTAHVINLNPAHYTVWLYRASTIISLNASITEELEWVNEIALENQKNYQIWHHRQLLIDHLHPSIADQSTAIEELALSETGFIEKMLHEDSKNYHVWSYRQYLVRKLQLFNSNELLCIEKFIESDIRNNSAWCHRFFLVFSNPQYASPLATAMDHDPQIPDAVIEREKAFAKANAMKAPQNPCPWNYLRGVLRKGGLKILNEEEWAANFANLGNRGTTDSIFVKSSHALEFLSEVWTENGDFEKADEALRLLGDKYDCIRKKYWDWKRDNLKTG